MRYMTPSQSRVARALLDWSRERTSEGMQEAVSVRWLEEFEAGRAKNPRKATLEALAALYEAKGIKFSRDGINVTLQAKPKRPRAKALLAALAFVLSFAPASAGDYRSGDTPRVVKGDTL